MTIAAYFADHEDRRERGNFAKSFFDGVPVEKTLSNGQTVDARIYEPLMEMFEAARSVNLDLLPNVESGYRSEEIEIPDTVTSIGASAFYRCSALNNVVIPDSVNMIGMRAFFQCVGLRTLTMPERLQSAGSNAFEGCDNLVISYS